jgi:hypothetical protein
MTGTEIEVVCIGGCNWSYEANVVVAAIEGQKLINK